MTDYTTVDDLKTYLHVSGEAEDALLAGLVARASRLIDDHCGRWFAAREETRAYDAVGPHITGRLLILDVDLLTLTELTNGDGATIDAGDVILRPLNWPPYFGISLKESSGLSWAYRNDPAGAICVEGQWGYSETPPEPIVQAAVRLAAWLYRQRDVIAGTPAALPHDVRDMIAPYVRLRIRTPGN